MIGFSIRLEDCEINIPEILSLEHVDFSNKGMSDETVIILASILQQSTNCKTLELDFSPQHIIYTLVLFNFRKLSRFNGPNNLISF